MGASNGAGDRELEPRAHRTFAGTIVTREIRADEFDAAAQLFFDSLADLIQRHGGEPPRRTRDVVATGYRHVARTGIFRVAALEDRIVALACATMRATQWFLSGFWAAPAVRLQGIGGPLLREVHEEGVRRGATTFYVWASIDEAALATYMKLGMLPGTQLFTFSGQLARVPDVPQGYVTEPLRYDAVAALERELVGVAREIDHDYWIERGFTARMVRGDGRVAGYYYIVDGIVGPAGWASDGDADAVLAHAMRDAAGSGTVSLSVPGVNHAAIRRALGAGLRLIRTSHLLWDRPVGAMDRYVPSGPMLF